MSDRTRDFRTIIGTRKDGFFSGRGSAHQDAA
jgi:hypothetical protein